MLRRIVVLSLAAATAMVLPAGPARATPDPIDARVRALMAAMTLPEKVGQMFVSYVYGDSATTAAPADVAANEALYGPGAGNGAAVLARYHLGGVIYFTWSGNLANPQQIGALSNGLQQAALASGRVPLLISTDQEGGVVNRIGAPLAVSPGNMALGATVNPLEAYRAARVSGTELRALGINVDDAPVVDVNTNPRNSADGARAFGDRTPAVSAFAVAAVAGYQAGGVAAQAKHFPGLGDTTVNTDNGVAVTNETRQQIMDTHVPPFRAAIAAGAKSVMVAHIVAPALDPSGRPASLSRPIVTGLLRGELRYDGVVVTDALDAAALRGIPSNQVVLDAIEAGDDILLMPPHLPDAVQAVLDAVRDGRISTERIDRSVHRILRMKAQLGLFTDPYTTPERISSTVGTPEHAQTMATAARRSITLLRNGGALPLATGRTVLVTGWGVAGPAVIAQAVAAARAADVTVVTTSNTWADTTQQDLVAALLGTGKPVVVVAVNGPYDIAYFPSAPTYLATYGYQPVSIAALVDTLLGANPTGRLPVTVRTPDGTRVLFPFGSGKGY
ncbi:MAG: hypothetical protein AUG44_16370 [Actinobacteria bacterium 13_1_20CM_3_71_11]|nr:MAG: hypothetical protein AUG44_16370 [Actinobacteria bacterium 13_1_20CM_3_71_11]